MKRKFILFLLALVMIFTLVSCPKEPEPVIPPVNNNGTNSGGTPPEVIPPGGDGLITPEGLVPLPTNVLYVFDEEKNPSYSSSTVALNTIFNPDELGQMVLVFDRSEWVKHLEYCLADKTHEECVVARGFYFTKDGKEWFFNDIGFRIRGNTSRISPQEIWKNEEGVYEYGKYQQAHFALDFEEWVEDDEDKKLADSMKGLILKRFKDDFTYSREIFAYNFFRNNGVWLAPRAAYTTLKIQIVDDMDLDGDGDVKEFETIDYGVYGMIEEVKKQFLKERTTKQGGGELESQKGNLWKCTHPSNFVLAEAKAEGKIGEEEFSFVKDEEENIIGSNKVTYPYDYKGDNELAEGKEQLLTFMEDLNNLPDCTDSDNDEADIETIKAFYTDRMDGDLFLKTYAINIILGMWDDYWINSNNFYFYFDTNGKAYFIPYDYDNSLGTNGGKTDCANQDPLNWGEFSDGPKPLIEKILQVPEYQETFKKYLDEFSNEDSLFDDDKSIAQITRWQNMIKDFIGSKDLKYNDTTPTFQDKVASWGEPNYPYTLYTPGDMNYFTVRQRSIQNYLYPSDGKKTLTINAGKGSNGEDKTDTLSFKFEPGTRFDEITKDIDYLPVYSDEIQKWYSYEEDGVYYVATALMDCYGNTFSFNDNRVLWDDATYEVYYSHYVPITLNFNGGTWWDEEKQETITDFIVKYYLADEWFSPNIWPEKEDCYFKEWIFEDGSKIEYVPSEATTVYAKWGPRSDFYDYLANGDIIGDFANRPDPNNKDNTLGDKLTNEGKGLYSYTFTYDSTTMNQWFGGSDNYPATDENGGIVEFKIRPNKAWDGTQIGIQYEGEQVWIDGGSPYCLVGGGNIVVHGLQEGCTYTIYYQVNDAYGGWVWIETSDIPSLGEPENPEELLMNGDIIGDFASWPDKDYPDEPSKNYGDKLTYEGKGLYSYTFTYSTTMNQWGSSEGTIQFKLRPNAIWDDNEIGIMDTSSQPTIGGEQVHCIRGEEIPNIEVSGLENDCSYTIYYQINDSYNGYVYIVKNY